MFAGVTTRRMAKAMANTDAGKRDVAVLALRGIGAAARQLAAATCRHYWPLALLAALISERCRQAVLIAAVLDGVLDWFTRNRAADGAEKPSVCWRIWCSSASMTSPTAPGCGRVWCASARCARSNPRSRRDRRIGQSITHSDVLIVGAGSAGSVLAERLSADPACHVTVVEAGLGPADPGVRALTANGLQLPIGAASPLVRRYRTLLTADQGSDIVRGTTVGGSGAVNGGYFCRALPRDFDEAALPGWSWAEVRRHYRAIETDLDFPDQHDGGPIRIRRTDEFVGSTAVFVDAAGAAGLRWLPDLNAEPVGDNAPPGVGAVPLNIVDGGRSGPGAASSNPPLTGPT